MESQTFHKITAFGDLLNIEMQRSTVSLPMVEAIHLWVALGAAIRKWQTEHPDRPAIHFPIQDCEVAQNALSGADLRFLGSNGPLVQATLTLPQAQALTKALLEFLGSSNTP